MSKDFKIKRSGVAIAMLHTCKSVFFHDKREPRGGSVNTLEELKAEVVKQTTEQLLIDAMNFAISKGVRINRGGAIFHRNNDWKIVSCNALGAVLCLIGAEDLVKEEFNPDWRTAVLSYLGEDEMWLWRFISGFDYGVELTFISECPGHSHEEKDKVSRLGNKLGKKFVPVG